MNAKYCLTDMQLLKLCQKMYDIGYKECDELEENIRKKKEETEKELWGYINDYDFKSNVWDILEKWLEELK